MCVDGRTDGRFEVAAQRRDVDFSARDDVDEYAVTGRVGDRHRGVVRRLLGGVAIELRRRRIHFQNGAAFDEFVESQPEILRIVGCRCE